MNFKKLTWIAVLAVSQAALALPASAAAVVPQQQQNTSVNQGLNGNALSGSDVSSKAANTNGTGNVNPGTATTGTTGDVNTPSGNPGTVEKKTVTGTTDDNAGTTDNGAVTDGSATDGAAGNPDDAGTSTTNPSTNGAKSGTPSTQSIADSGKDQLILMMNSNKMYQNGKLYLAGQPMAVKNGVSYVAIRAMVERAGLKLTYNNQTKETIINKDGNELRFKTNSSSYRVNGVVKGMKGNSYQQNNVFMVPLTSITQALNIPYTVDQVQKRVILTLSTKPVATFKVQPSEIFAGETKVSYVSDAKSPSGLPIVNERWEGKEDVFQNAGSYTITHYVQDSSEQWSDPYSVTVNVIQPNQPPVANFVTNKDEYKMGEMITITDQSTDDENAILNRQWLNNRLAFFEPGPVTIKLTVTDKHGAVGEFEKTINIKNETLYTQEDFNKIFVPIGDKYTFDGTKVPTWNKVNYTYTSEPATLIRSNSPETVYSEGILYQETAMGSTRFMVHHVNSLSKDTKVYVIATNTNNDVPANINILNSGFGGPSPYPTATGKVSVEKYFNSMTSGSNRQDIHLNPGESKVIFNDLINTKIKPGQVISLLADTFSDYPIKYTVIMIDAAKDPLTTLPYLTNLERDVHNRGTYPDSVRIIKYDEQIGSTPARFVLGDDKDDPNMMGLDGINGTVASNAGNFGAMYKMTFSKVAPNTIITLNPRGGPYGGVLMVDGRIVQTSSGLVNAPNETSVLARTNNYEQSVEIWYTPAPGSNLPINLLFMPIPQTKN